LVVNNRREKHFVDGLWGKKGGVGKKTTPGLNIFWFGGVT